ncbi:anti-sigma factor [Streptomyces sp. NK15101]|uniref:anti-sigma factor n=1 Tax=Streptomyces sp. NK15101 TaxID=2873261 RepID=UPI001CECDAF7|nr:anti-sigma factor [Streptomyces sp. NK15101]
MKHADEETLVMMALGEETDPTTSLHLHECDHCRQEYDSLRRIVSAMRTPAPAEHDLLPPPDHVWNSIAAELRIPHRHDSPRAHDDTTAPVRRPRPKNLRRSGRLTLALAACAALFGAASGSALTWWLTRPGTPVVRTVADAKPLDSLRADSAGYAGLKDDTGRRSLEITVKGLPRTSGYFEVWLMDRTHTKLVSMGVLGPDGHAVLPLPATIDLNEYPVVDVSVQAYDGRPDHSGDSIVRGPYAG